MESRFTTAFTTAEDMEGATEATLTAWQRGVCGAIVLCFATPVPAPDASLAYAPALVLTALVLLLGAATSPPEWATLPNIITVFRMSLAVRVGLSDVHEHDANSLLALGVAFVALGAGYLAGDDSVQTVLADRGVTVTRE